MWVRAKYPRTTTPSICRDDKDLEREGHKDKAKSNIKQAGEKIKDAVRDV